MKQKKRAIIYVRVSTDDQGDGYSPAYQLERLKQYCKDKDYEVVGVFEDKYSAKTFDRPQYQNMLGQLKSGKLKTDWLLFIKWDRFSRNALDAYQMIAKLKTMEVQVQATEQPLDLKVPENKLMLAVYLAFPEVENDRRGLNVTSGMRRAKKEGRWMATAPKGYKNVTDESGKKKYILPDANAPIIIWAFEELATGLTTVIDVLRRARIKGLDCSRNNFWKLIRNPVYCGKIMIPATEDEEAQLVQGQHEPLISEELFYEVQDVLDGRKRNVPIKNTLKEELPLRGSLICRKCGSNLTGSGSTGKLGGRYYYYHCQRGCDERFSANDANRLFVEGLKSFSVKKEAIDLYYVAMKKAFIVNKTNQSQKIASIKREIETLQQRVEKGRDLMLDDKIDANDFREIKTSLLPQIETLNRKLNSHHNIDGDYRTFIEEGFGILKNLPETYSQADIRAKQQIVGSIFPEKLIFENNQYRTPKLLGAFARILSNDGYFKPKTKRTEAIFVPQSPMVIPLGFEPRTPTLKV